MDLKDMLRGSTTTDGIKTTVEPDSILYSELEKALSKTSTGDWVFDDRKCSIEKEESEGEGGCNPDCNCQTRGATESEHVCKGVKQIDTAMHEKISDVEMRCDDKLDVFNKRMDKDFKKLTQIVNSTRTIEIKTNKGKKKTLKGKSIHEKFELVLDFLVENIPVLVYGETGSGKTFMAKQIADVNDWDYYFCNQVTEEYKLTGYMDATGKYQTTSFFEAFTKGGLFCIDEIDASIPEVIVCLNMALANGKFNFPHGQFDMHPEFRVIACANTIGGATSDYTGRNKLDKATLDRFVTIEMNYDNQLERKIITNDTVELLIALRHYVTRQKKINVSFSTRCGLYYDKMKKKGLSHKDLVQNVLLRGVDIEDFKDFGYGSDNPEVDAVRSAILTLVR